MLESEKILERFRTSYHKDIDLTLRPAYRELLEKLGAPHRHLPPVFHVAGTNGKGSTCAFLRSILEAAGYRVHVYTSPHLVRFHERIRVAGKLISEAELAGILAECERLATPHGISYFEAATAAAFTAFARTPADFTILEVGLGGRLDATNVIENPIASIITRLSFDHREYLGDTLTKIAGEKAGIMKQGVPCFVGMHNVDESLNALRATAAQKQTPLSIGGIDWHIKPTTSGFHYTDAKRDFDLPAPALPGQHQYENAGLAITALSALSKPLPQETIARGITSATWPARLQHIAQGKLTALLPKNCELWLDGGHNDSAGEVLATQIAAWHAADARPLHIICGMLTTKKPLELLHPFAQFISSLTTVTVPHEPLSFTAKTLADEIKVSGITHVESAASLQNALTRTASLTQGKAARVLICGSLYLAGHVLHENGDRPE